MHDQQRQWGGENEEEGDTRTSLRMKGTPMRRVTAMRHTPTATHTSCSLDKPKQKANTKGYKPENSLIMRSRPLQKASLRGGGKGKREVTEGRGGVEGEE